MQKILVRRTTRLLRWIRWRRPSRSKPAPLSALKAPRQTPAVLRRRTTKTRRKGIKMEFFRIRRDLPIMQRALIFNAISLITFLAAVFFLVHRGLHLSVEFTGGTVVEVQYAQAAPLEPVRAAMGALGYPDVQVQNFGSSRDALIRLPLKAGLTSAQQSEQVLSALKKQDSSVQLQRVEFVGPQVGKELVTNGLLALACVVAGIMIYLAIRFEWKYAVAGVIANLHDVVIILGVFAVRARRYPGGAGLFSE